MRISLLLVLCAFTTVAAYPQATPAKPKLYISNSNDWQKAGGFKSKFASGDPNAVPNSAHLSEVSAMASQCGAVEVTSDPSKAQYIVLWDTKAIWNALSARTNLLIMYTPKGDAVYSIRSDSMASAAKHVCGYFNAPATPASTSSKPAPKPAS